MDPASIPGQCNIHTYFSFFSQSMYSTIVHKRVGDLRGNTDKEGCLFGRPHHDRILGLGDPAGDELQCLFLHRPHASYERLLCHQLSCTQHHTILLKPLCSSVRILL